MNPAVSARRRVLVFGIDGVPCHLLEKLAAQGVMPTVRALLPTGTLRPMRVPLPEVSSVSWSTFYTGVNPARHGIFGFVDLAPGSMRLMYPDFNHNRAPTTWDMLGQAGKTSIVVNLPDTYPARSLRGAMVSGFVAPELTKSVFPRTLLPLLRALDYRLDVKAELARAGRLDDFLTDVTQTLERRGKAFDALWTFQPWDYFVACVTETDRLHHFLWDALTDPRHRLHGACLEVYQRVDAILARLVDRLTPQDLLFLVSDHGFTSIRQEVAVNAWLEAQDFLRFRGPRSLDQLDVSSQAFALDPGRIYLNTQARFAQGCLSASQAIETRHRLKEALLAWRHLEADGTQTPVLEAVFEKEEIYHGPLLDQAPELVLLASRGFDLKGALDRTAIFASSALQGMHTWDDATCFLPWQGLPPRQPHMQDLTPTILEALQVVPTSPMDGRSLLQPAGEGE